MMAAYRYDPMEGREVPVEALTNAPRLSFTLYRDIDPEPRKSWLVRDFLGEGEQSCWFGPPGSAKSTIVGDLGAHIAAGIDWFGRRVEQGGVLYVAAERAELVKRRLAAFRKYYRLADIPLAVVSGPADLRSNSDDAELIEGYGRQLAGETGIPTRLIIIETVSRTLAGGDENSSKDMGAMVRILGGIADQTGAHVLIVHHIPVDGSQRLRGHGSLLGAMDTTVRVEKIGNTRAASVDKVNDGPEGERITFDLQSVDLHHDPETGITTTAPVVVEAEAITVDASPRLTPNQQTMLTILQEAMPNGLTTEEWNANAREAGMGSTPKQRLYDCRIALKNKRLVHEYAGRWFISSRQERPGG